MPHLTCATSLETPHHLIHPLEQDQQAQINTSKPTSSTSDQLLRGWQAKSRVLEWLGLPGERAYPSVLLRRAGEEDGIEFVGVRGVYAEFGLPDEYRGEGECRDAVRRYWEERKYVGA